ncbi:MAG TPA: transcriptional repressor [Armatimonadetes bacterium]|nr:transcriptional repressor [Armatimonadota bacterium]
MALQHVQHPVKEGCLASQIGDTWACYPLPFSRAILKSVSGKDTSRAAVDKFNTFLRSRGMRVTSARKAVVEEVFTRPGHSDPEELVRRLSRRGVSRASVYRTLSLLERAGLIRRVLYGERHSHYERVLPGQHHDHLVCEICGRVVEFECPQIEQLQADVAKQHGFQVTGHVMEIRGICSTCAKRKGRRRKKR